MARWEFNIAVFAIFLTLLALTGRIDPFAVLGYWMIIAFTYVPRIIRWVAEGRSEWRKRMEEINARD